MAPKVPFDRLASFETVVKFIIKANSTPPCDDDFLGIYLDPVESNPATRGRHVFSVQLDHDSGNPDYLKLEIFINDISRSSVVVPIEILGKELTLTASYVADTKEIKASINDGPEVSLIYDLGLILKGHVEVGLFISPNNVVVSYWDFNWTSTGQ